MTAEINVRRAKLSDAGAIAEFINSAHSGDASVSRLDVAERFGQVGFIVAERDDDFIGLLGWQVENLVVRVTDFLISSSAERLATGRAMIDMMEDEGKALQAEAIILILPADASSQLVAFWEDFGYEFQSVDGLERAWQEAAAEWGLIDEGVMVKRLREDLIQRPM